MKRLLPTLWCVLGLAAFDGARHAPVRADEPPPSAAAATAAATPDAGVADKRLPAEHVPQLHLTLDPARTVHIGEVVHLQISADALLGDDVTIAEQSFAPFEVHQKRARVEPPSGQRQRFVFELELLGLEASDKPVPAIDLRVVTKDGFVGSVQTQAQPYAVRSWLGNEPNAQPKLETKPVAVRQDNWWPIYIAGALAAIALIAGLTLLVSRYLRSRVKPLPPPVPKRPAWDVAIEKLGELRRRKQTMLEAGQGGLFVDQVSDVVREYLGGRYAFDGLETTSDEMLGLLRKRNAGVGFTQEVGVFLGRCDLVKFAKVEPDQDEADLIFGKAQDLVQGSRPPVAASLPGQQQPPQAPPQAPPQDPPQAPPTAADPSGGQP
jgi:hypothetical protein